MARGKTRKDTDTEREGRRRRGGVGALTKSPDLPSWCASGRRAVPLACFAYMASSSAGSSTCATPSTPSPCPHVSELGRVGWLSDWMVWWVGRRVARSVRACVRTRVPARRHRPRPAARQRYRGGARRGRGGGEGRKHLIDAVDPGKQLLDRPAVLPLVEVPEDVNWPHRQIPSTNRHLISLRAG